MTIMTFWFVRIVLALGGVLAVAGTGVVIENVSGSLLVTTSGHDLIRAGHWEVAGVDPAHTSLVVHNSNLAIVRQDGSPGQPNPSVNLYGTYLRVRGGFSITMKLTDINNEADVDLYGTPPLIEDEFRAEEGTVSLAITGASLTVRLAEQRDGTLLKPTQYDINRSRQHTLMVVDSDGQFSFVVDGRSTGGVADKGIFRSGQVWFGFDAPTSHSSFTVETLRAQRVSDGSVAVEDSRRIAIQHSPDGLAERAKLTRPGFLLGAAVAPGPMVADATYRLLLSNFSAVTTENAGKFQTIHPLPGNQPSDYNFSDMDTVVGIARASGMTVQGHALVFGEANPAWVQSLAQHHPDQLQQVMIDHIKTVVGRYRGVVHGWDVVNEPLADYGSSSGDYDLRRNIWYNALGSEYIATALRAAHSADPSVGLWINEFGLETDDQRFAQMLVLVKHLQAEGVPLTGIGFQAHIDDGDTIEGDTHVDTSLLRSRISAVAALGLKVRFSELDISNPSEYPVFADVIRSCLSESACVGVTLWGVTDKYSSSGDLDSHGIFEAGTGLPWDSQERPLPPVALIRSALGKL